MSRWPTLLVLLFALLLTACSGGLADPLAGEGASRERILLWHTWDAAQTETLNAMLTAYQDINPNTKVIGVAVPEDSLLTRLERRSRAGLGPDLVLANAGQIYNMAEAGLVRDLGPLDLDLSSYLSGAIGTLSDGTRLYGLPMATHTHVLYFNRNLVSEPPATTDEVLERAQAGEVFAQSPHFNESYWGVGAFDGGIVDSQNRLILGQGGFSNWLDFLGAARTLPGFLIEANPEALRQAFVDGEAAYYVGDSDQLGGLVAAMGEDAVGVALLPTGPNGGAPRPFLNVDALALTPVSNSREFQQALDLARYLTDVQNQLNLTTADIGLAPVNNRVRLTPNLPENSLTVARQSRTAETIEFRNWPFWNDLQNGALGFFDSYQQVTQGLLAADDMVAQSLHKFEETYGLIPLMPETQEQCPAQPAPITVWHSLRLDEAQAVKELANQFEETCPGTTLALTYVPNDEISNRFREAQNTLNSGEEAPDMLILSSRWLAPLAEEGLLLDLTERVDSTYLQQFLPETVGAMRYDGRLYGIPESLEVLALYINSELVADPPIDFQQLVQKVTSDNRLAMPVGFFQAYWGMNPFGGFSFDSKTGQIRESEGLLNWLTTLQQIDMQAGIDFYFDAAEAVDAFATEKAAYLVSGPWSLPRLRQELGSDRFRVVPLPNGPLMAGSPMLQTIGTVISADASDPATDTALAFSRFLNSRASQERLAATGGHVSASVTADLSDYPKIEGFREQAKSGALVVENSNFARMEAQGDLLYESVLIDGASPIEAVPAFVEAVDRANGVEE